jgi:hypothetical protein
MKRVRRAMATAAGAGGALCEPPCAQPWRGAGCEPLIGCQAPCASVCQLSGSAAGPGHRASSCAVKHLRARTSNVAVTRGAGGARRVKRVFRGFRARGTAPGQARGPGRRAVLSEVFFLGLGVLLPSQGAHSEISDSAEGAARRGGGARWLMAAAAREDETDSLHQMRAPIHCVGNAPAGVITCSFILHRAGSRLDPSVGRERPHCINPRAGRRPPPPPRPGAPDGCDPARGRIAVLRLPRRLPAAWAPPGAVGWLAVRRPHPPRE